MLRRISMLRLLNVALGAQLAVYASSHGRARILSGSSIISAGGNRMVLLSVLQKAIASLNNPSDPSAPLFVDALLQFFFLLHVLSSSSSSIVFRISGMVPPLLSLLTDSDPTHVHLVSSAVKMLQKLMEYSSTTVSIFKDNRGVELLSDTLRIEVDKIIGTVDKNNNAMVIGDSVRHDDDYLYSSIILSKSQLLPKYKVDHPVSSAIFFLLPYGNKSFLSLAQTPLLEGLSLSMLILMTLEKASTSSYSSFQLGKP